MDLQVAKLITTTRRRISFRVRICFSLSQFSKKLNKVKLLICKSKRIPQNKKKRFLSKNMNTVNGSKIESLSTREYM